MPADAAAPLNHFLSGETQKPHSLGFVVIRESEREEGGNRLILRQLAVESREVAATRRFGFLNRCFHIYLGLS